VILFN